VRILYNLLAYLLQIPVAVYWLVRAIGNSTYRDGFGQRFGIGYPKFSQCIWIHAVSVGEVQAAAPLIRQVCKRFPDRNVLITTVTPTGAAHVRTLFGDTVAHSYIPFELPIAVDRFFKNTQPELALIMETEIWPNLYRGCGVREIPLILVSARISPRSLQGYRKVLPLFKETLSHGIIIAAQSKVDADRFRSLGASSVRTWVIGNIKFDIELPENLAGDGRDLRAKMFGDRPIWVAASTHDQEEQQVLAAHAVLKAQYPNLLLVLVPRHPERFNDVRKLLEQQEFTYASRTQEQSCEESTEVFLVDTMGELPLFYAASDIAFVGGSLVPVGGHNLLEPAALGVPVVTGPYNFNAQDLADLFIELGACRRVADTDELVAVVSELLTNPEEAARLGRAGQVLLEDNRGALERLLVLLEPLLGERGGV